LGVPICRAEFAFDEQLKPALFVKCKVGVNEQGAAGKFGIAFGVMEDLKHSGRSCFL